MFWMHDAARVPGRWLEMGEDDKGLAVKGELAETELGREMRTLAQMKAVRGLSIGYQIKDADFDDDGNRLLKEIDLWEVSLVSLAMNPLAQIESAKSRLSSAGEYIPTEREFEKSLRAAGCSKNIARALIAKIFDGGEVGGMPAEPRWDADDIDAEAKALLESLERSTGSIVREAFRR
jgi:hypothetical protein